MKKLGAGLIVSLVGIASFAQEANKNNTLLWKISGNGLERPSYLFGTIHLLCEEDAVLSKNMMKAIKDCDEVYFEVDMDNMFEMISVIGKMKMKGDTTLKDLLSK
jgi:uncharacterized protein YbaP (TraB family)